MPQFNAIWNDDAIKLQAEAKTNGHTRLLAYALYGEPSPDCLTWQSFPDEAAMQTFIANFDNAESMAMNCAIPVAVINPQDSDETTRTLLTNRKARTQTGPGYFPSALSF